MKLNNTMKINGELAARNLSAIAQKYYRGADPLALYEYDTDDGKRYAIKDDSGIRYGLTFEQVDRDFSELYDLYRDDEDDE